MEAQIFNDQLSATNCIAKPLPSVQLHEEREILLILEQRLRESGSPE